MNVKKLTSNELITLYRVSWLAGLKGDRGADNIAVSLFDELALRCGGADVIPPLTNDDETTQSSDVLVVEEEGEESLPVREFHLHGTQVHTGTWEVGYPIKLARASPCDVSIEGISYLDMCGDAGTRVLIEDIDGASLWGSLKNERLKLIFHCPDVLSPDARLDVTLTNRVVAFGELQCVTHHDIIALRRTGTTLELWFRGNPQHPWLVEGITKFSKQLLEWLNPGTLYAITG